MEKRFIVEALVVVFYVIEYLGIMYTKKSSIILKELFIIKFKAKLFKCFWKNLFNLKVSLLTA